MFEPAHSSAEDPQGTYEKVYYLSRHFQALWTNTRAACVAYGMDTLSLETLEEANHFLALCQQNAGFFDQWTHVGAIALAAKSTNFWYWVNSGKRITYPMKFLPGQPDNAGGRELCLSIGKDPSGFRFNDLNCYGNHDFKFVCQKSQVNIVF